MDEQHRIDRLLRVGKILDEHQSLQQAQKMRGLNDFNIFTTLLKKSDEVRLHSGFLQFLLNPGAAHCQGPLFLNLFLRECGFPEGFLNLENCKVFKEQQYIDIYITDGRRHIIIENKIYAADQNRQIARYIESIKNDNVEDTDLPDNLVVVYLSLNRDAPSENSLAGFELIRDMEGQKDYLLRDDERYRFMAITYDKQILDWIAKARAEVANITNLSVVMTQYRDVILMLYGRYKEKVMSLREFIEHRSDKRDLYRSMKVVSEKYQALREELMKDFFEASLLILEKAINDDMWRVSLADTRLISGKKFGFPLRVDQEQLRNSKVLFGFEFAESSHMGPSWGIVRSDASIDFQQLKSYVVTELDGLDHSLDKEGTWWLRLGYYDMGDLYDRIVDAESFELAVEEFTQNFIKVFESCKETIMKCNSLLDA